jgi:thiazole/oxazole-forming peptide maturase SagC family component
MSDQPTRTYSLATSVRMFHSGDEIRFRKGIWSYTEAAIQLSALSGPDKDFFVQAYDRLVRGETVDVEEVAIEVGAPSRQAASYAEVLDALVAQGFLATSDTIATSPINSVRDLLGTAITGIEEYVTAPRPALLLADTESARVLARSLATEMRFPLDVLDDQTQQRWSTLDLTTATDAVEHADAASQIELVVERYGCVLACLVNPNLSLLRNLNRVLIRLEKPLILAMVDGPFVSVTGFVPQQTGCFECFEQRMLVRLEDSAAYHDFLRVKASALQSVQFNSAYLHILTSAVIGEAYLQSTMGMFRVAGRTVNVYLPLLEIQVQDLLRVPYCPACGFVARAQMQDLYVSSRALINELLDRQPARDRGR